MKNTASLNLTVKAALAIVLFSLGFSRAAAKVDPANTVSTHSVNMVPPIASCYDR